MVRPSLDGKQFDVIVIGGGINGVAIARECARAGVAVLLIEAHDFASGTTSRSTRIIHGGLRYLEHGEIGLVRESLRERERLVSEYGYLVHPLSFVLAVSPHQSVRRSALAVRFGLWLYSRMGGGNGRAGHVRAGDELEKQLDRGSSWALFEYEDAQCEFPELLVAEWLAEALEAGVTARNYTEALEVGIENGRAKSLLVRDSFTCEEMRIDAKWVINATGPWADRICGASGISSREPMVGGVRGTHIVVKRPAFLDHVADYRGSQSPTLSRSAARSGANVGHHAIYAEGTDGRPIFVVPWNGALLIGTTEVRDSGDPGHVEPSAAEIGYLLRSVQRLLPGLSLDSGDVAYAFAGVRPLPFSRGAELSKISRKHALHDHKHEGAAGMISVIGGKLTTAASLARECARKIGSRVRNRPRALVAAAPFGGFRAAIEYWAQTVAANVGITVESARAIAEWNGPLAFEITRLTRRHPELRKPICDGSPHILAEVAYAMERECAVTLGDILLRRVPVALSPDWRSRSTATAASAIASLAGWDASETQEQIANFEEERARFLQRVEPSIFGSSVESLPAPAKRAA